MNSATNLTQRRCLKLFMGMLFISVSAYAADTPPIVVKQDQIDQVQAVMDKMLIEGAAIPIANIDATASKAETAQKDSSAAIMSNDDIIALLRDGNNTKPLSVTQLSAINDVIKRMEYMSEIEKKMSEMGLDTGVSRTPTQTRTPAPSAEQPTAAVQPLFSAKTMGGNLSVVRVSAVAGSYTAVVTDGTRQNIMRVGDETSEGRIVSITINGVRVSTNRGAIVDLPFTSAATSSGIRATVQPTSASPSVTPQQPAPPVIVPAPANNQIVPPVIQPPTRR